MERAVVRQPGQVDRFGDAVHRGVRHDGARPGLVVGRIVLEQHELAGRVDRVAAGNEVDPGVVVRHRRRPVEVVRRPGRPDDEQVVRRRRRRVGELAHPHAARADRGRLVLAVGERRDRVHAVRRERHPERIGEARLDRLVDRRIQVGIRAAEARRAGGRTHREAVERAEAVVVQVVVVGDDEVAVAELGHEVKRLRAAEGRDHRLPGAAVGLDRPDPPEALVAQALILVRREHQAAVAEDRRVERRRDRHRRDRRHVPAVLVHHVELQRRRGVPLLRPEAVAVRGEGDPAARQRARAEVEDAVAEAIEAGGRVERVRLVPVAAAGIRRELAVGELLDLPRRQMDAEDVRTPVRQVVPLIVELRVAHVVEVGVVDPLGVERDERVGDRAVAAGDQDLLGAVRMQQHQVGAGVDPRRMKDLGPGAVLRCRRSAAGGRRRRRRRLAAGPRRRQAAPQKATRASRAAARASGERSGDRIEVREIVQEAASAQGGISQSGNRFGRPRGSLEESRGRSDAFGSGRKSPGNSTHLDSSAAQATPPRRPAARRSSRCRRCGTRGGWRGGSRRVGRRRCCRPRSAGCGRRAGTRWTGSGP